ncbi:ornithine cyclodeaminase family protein [Mesorhizobium kowhaii]|uniref:Ornithine cyclodeaminase n=1 Tax=Mesorhizobium kowhaii TaxID=1300272 RepID=A0A2W7CEK3_9HYPH|nr:ornithine cyclodeaminase family protein [Mesorhizobium kowhaii]PZV34913.1 ornithine cyclodeaminase [Mesorhizobium kowhaii]
MESIVDSNLPASAQPGSATSVPYLSRFILERLGITTHEAVDSIEHLIRGQRAGKVWCAPKVVVLPGDERYIMATLAVADEPRMVATKSLVLNPRNRKRGIAVINSLVTLHDSETGLPLAVVEGNWVTARRTAGLSAVAAKRLARSDSVSIGFIGCGVEARSHLDAFCDLFPVRQIYAFGRGSENRDALCRAAEARGLVAIASKTPREAIGDADLIVTSVTLLPNLDPFLDARWLKPGAFVTSIDLALPWLPEGMGAFQRIVIDDLEQEAKMIRPMVAPALVAGDLSGLVCGEIAGREGAQELTAFVFRGLAVGDLALAALAYHRAKTTGTISG